MLSLLLAILAPFAWTAAIAPLDRASGGEADRGIVDGRDGGTVRQVRIEERIILRIPPGVARRPLPPPPAAAAPQRWREQPTGSCLRASAVAGVRIDDDSSLLLVMRGHRVIRAVLDRTCSARDFYSGFYVERSGDGLLCAGRDLLLARNGASCSVARLRLLSPAGR